MSHAISRLITRNFRHKFTSQYFATLNFSEFAKILRNAQFISLAMYFKMSLKLVTDVFKGTITSKLKKGNGDTTVNSNNKCSSHMSRPSSSCLYKYDFVNVSAEINSLFPDYRHNVNHLIFTSCMFPTLLVRVT